MTPMPFTLGDLCPASEGRARSDRSPSTCAFRPWTPS
jgi:hypothetical protein